MRRSNGKKFAFVIVTITIISCVIAVGSIMAFYKFYEPEKFGRNHGGVDSENIEVEIYENK
jgi:hypothetical protein